MKLIEKILNSCKKVSEMRNCAMFLSMSYEAVMIFIFLLFEKKLLTYCMFSVDKARQQRYSLHIRMELHPDLRPQCWHVCHYTPAIAVQNDICCYDKKSRPAYNRRCVY